MVARADIAVVATVFNERASLPRLLQSLREQSLQPDEVVIVDAGSTDGTWELLQGWQEGWPLVRALQARGVGRSEGRNIGFRAAVSSWIAVTDAGVVLDRHWLAQLMAAKAAQPLAGVVGGFFCAAPSSFFELALGAVTLPRREEIDGARFLPSSRSVLVAKAAWQAAGGYPEWLDLCEDLVFDLQLRSNGVSFAFAPEAFVWFRPRTSVRRFFQQYFGYARGDGRANLWLGRHCLRYATYWGMFVAVAACGATRSWLMRSAIALLLGGGAVGYLRRPYQRLMRSDPALWASAPWHRRVVPWLLIPLLRFEGDVAKMVGFPLGVWWRFWHRRGQASVISLRRVALRSEGRTS